MKKFTAESAEAAEIYEIEEKRIISNLVGRSDQLPCCPGKRAGVEAKKGRDQTFFLTEWGMARELLSALAILREENR